MSKTMEDPCEETGGPCDWVCEEDVGMTGEVISWDLYCARCYRYRNWAREEFVPPVAVVRPEDGSHHPVVE